MALAVTPDSRYLISGSADDRAVKVFDLQIKQEIHHFQGVHKDRINSVAVSPDGRYVASGSDDRTIKVFDIQSKQEIHHFRQAHKNSVQSVAFTPDGKHIISGSLDKSIKVFSVPSESAFLVSPSTSHAYLSSDRIFLDLLQLTDPIKKNAHLSSSIQFSYLPHSWNSLHFLAILKPEALQDIPSFEQMQAPFLVDVYNKTPLHYLFAHEELNLIAIESIFKYILSFLESHSATQSSQYLSVIDSLSDIISPILSNVNPKLVTTFLKFIYSKPIDTNSIKLPQFGSVKEPQNRSKVIASGFPYINPSIQDHIHVPGTSMITFRCILLSLPGKYSQEMLKFIFCLSNLKNEDFFRSKSLSIVIDYLWDLHRSFHLIVGGFYSTLMILLSVYVGIGERLLPLEIVIFVFATAFLLLEFLQIFLLRSSYFHSVWNALDLIYFPLLMSTMITRFADVEDELTRSWLYTASILVGYSRWISYLRIMPSTRTLIRAILVILEDMKGFIIIITMIIIGFSLVFYEFGRASEENYASFLLSTYGLLYGNYETEGLELSATLILALILFLLSVVLLNMLIAIMGDSYDKVQDRKILTDSQERIEMILESTVLMRFFVRKQSRLEERIGYLIFYESLGEGDEEDQAMSTEEWEGKINALKKMIRQTGQDLEGKVFKRMQDLEGRIGKGMHELEEKISKSNQGLEKRMTEILSLLKNNKQEAS